MMAVISKASILSLGLIFIPLYGLIRPCIAGAADQPGQIIRKMYSDLLNSNFAGDITSKSNRAKYFVPSQVSLYDASDAAEALGNTKKAQQRDTTPPASARRGSTRTARA